MNHHPPATPARRETPAATVHKSKWLSTIWVVPLAAAAIAGQMVLKHLQQSGPAITIQFDEGMGLQANHTPIRYRGVRVGDVRSVGLTKDTRHIVVEARLDRSSATLAREGSLFWVVRPEAGAGWLRGLETIVAGSYIQVRPGKGRPAKTFVGLERIPTAEPPNGGLEIALTASKLGSISAGSPVFYRELEVGAVQNVALSSDASSVTIHLLIEPRYVTLVRADSKFWNAGGFNLDLGFLGVKLKTTSLKSLVMGGVAFASPTNLAPPAVSGATFQLNDRVEEKWLKWSPSIKLPPE